MSRGNMYVLFPDGDVRYGIYNGTADMAHPPLQPTTEFTWEEWRCVGPWRAPYVIPEGPDQPVVIASDYGGGFSWRGRATRDYLTEGLDPYEAQGYEKGLPNWATYPPPITVEMAKLELPPKIGQNGG